MSIELKTFSREEAIILDECRKASSMRDLLMATRPVHERLSAAIKSLKKRGLIETRYGGIYRTTNKGIEAIDGGFLFEGVRQ